MFNIWIFQGNDENIHPSDLDGEVSRQQYFRFLEEDCFHILKMKTAGTFCNFVFVRATWMPTMPFASTSSWPPTRRPPLLPLVMATTLSRDTRWAKEAFISVNSLKVTFSAQAFDPKVTLGDCGKFPYGYVGKKVGKYIWGHIRLKWFQRTLDSVFIFLPT